ncbi:MAG: hypothetical protein IKS48_05145 [Eubacterium sp.]|nr:hypothetical protein [Eubacterium sp.]
MSDIINVISEMKTETLVVLIFAALLLIFLLVLIVITIKVLRTNELSDDDTEEEELPDIDVEEDESAARSKMVDELAKSVEEARAKMEAERKFESSDDEDDETDDEDDEFEDEDEDERAKKSAKERVEAITRAVTGEEADDENEDDYDEDEDFGADMEYEEESDTDEEDKDTDDESDEETSVSVKDNTDKPDEDRIEEELRKVREKTADNIEGLNETAKLRAESPDYNASFDSAFVEKPDNDEEKEEPVIPNPTVESVLGEEKPEEDEEDEVPAGSTLDVSEEETLRKAVRKARSGDKITVNPVNEVKINTVNSVEKVNTTNPKAGINDMEDMKDFMEENPEPKAKKRKVKKKDLDFEEKFGTHGDEIKTAKYFWYNTQDIEGLARKEDMYFKCHYFDDADNAILDLVTEMYDCAFVRTEQLQRIAYGITFQSMGMKDILRSEEKLGFNRNKATKEPTEADKEEVYRKWCEYVDNFHKIIVINAPEDIEEYMINKMYEYGRRDVEELMYSPY